MPRWREDCGAGCTLLHDDCQGACPSHLQNDLAQEMPGRLRQALGPGFMVGLLVTGEQEQ